MRAFILLLAACGGPDAPPKPVNQNTQLTATLSLARHDYFKDADVEVTVELANPTKSPIEIPAQALESPILFFEVSDESGKHIDTVSPPAPRADKVSFAPGEHKTIKLILSMFSPPLTKGEYIVAPAKAIAVGNPASFSIK